MRVRIGAYRRCPVDPWAPRRSPRPRRTTSWIHRARRAWGRQCCRTWSRVRSVPQRPCASCWGAVRRSGWWGWRCRDLSPFWGGPDDKVQFVRCGCPRINGKFRVDEGPSWGCDGCENDGQKCGMSVSPCRRWVATSVSCCRIIGLGWTRCLVIDVLRRAPTRETGPSRLVSPIDYVSPKHDRARTARP